MTNLSWFKCSEGIWKGRKQCKKSENAGYKHFLLFQQCFHKPFYLQHCDNSGLCYNQFNQIWYQIEFLISNFRSYISKYILLQKSWLILKSPYIKLIMEKKKKKLWSYLGAVPDLRHFTGYVACPRKSGSPNTSSSWTTKRIRASSGHRISKSVELRCHTGFKPLSAGNMR